MKKLDISIYQKNFYLEWRLDPTSTKYNTPLTFEIEGQLNVNALKQAVSAFINYCENQRTYFIEENDQIKQVVVDKIDVEVEEYDLTALDVKTAKKKSDQILKGIYHHQFNLHQLPLFRYGLIKLAKQKFIFVLNHHHITCDAFSAEHLIYYISSKYNQLAFGEDFTPGVLPCIQKYIAYEKENYSQSAREKDLSYWEQELSDVPLSVSLPKMHFNKQDASSSGGASVYFELSHEVSLDLKKLARANRTTTFIVLSSIWAYVVSRYSGQQEIILHYQINARPPQFSDLLGCFVNTVLMKIDVNQTQSVSDFINSVTQQRKITKPQQKLALFDIVKRLRSKKSYEENAFNVSIFEANLGYIGLDLKNCKTTGIPSSHHFINDLALAYQYNLETGRFHFRLDYKNTVFDSKGIRKLMSHLKNILNQFLSRHENQDFILSNIKLLKPIERQQILVDWNNTAAPYPKDKTISQLFEEQVERTPDNTAVVFEDQELTYTELNARANQLACLIRTKYKQQNKKDLKPDSLIGLCVERSLDMIISILGILKAGAAYVPLDPDYPQDRLEYMIKDSHEGLIITQKSVVERDGFLDKLHHDELLVIDSDQVKVDLKKQSNANLKAISGPSDLAYVIYTSGSTARPKGVMIEHKSVINVISDFSQLLAVATGKCFLSLSSMNFDIFVLEYTLPLFNGCQCVIASESTKRDMVLLENLFNRHRPDFAQGTPSLWNVLAAQLPELNNPLTILTGGEKLSNGLKDKLIKIAPEVYNVYGPTEATIWSTHERCQKDKRVSIGKPLSNTRCFVLDVNNNPSPIGTPGELYIGGAGLARGYLNQKELTNERFIPNPFAEELGLSKTDRIYKTGDLVRWLPDGNIEYLGRTDFQVKIRGFRIELGEIENTLGKHKSISQVCVVALDKDNQKYLAAYYVLAQGKPEPGIDELRAYLSETLPDYMVPAAFVKLDEMPLTPNGKVNRKALPDPDMSLMGEDYVAPRDDVEQKLADVWCETLKIEQVGAYDHFFNLGGNSLLIIQLQSKIKGAFNIDFGIADIFQYPTVFSFAEFIRGKLGISKKTNVKQTKKSRSKSGSDKTGSQDIAIIGLACRAPGADSIEEFWNNLENSVESIRDLTDEELLSANIDQKLLNDTNYVKRGGFVNNLEDFDAHFFGYSRREAESLDPQMRHFFECAWSALEDSGVIRQRSELSAGVFSGKGSDQYIMENIINSPDVINSLGWWHLNVNNNYLSSKVSYHFNLDGPSFDVNTACSTGLVSVKLAIDGILNGECNIALAGGVTLNQKSGYLYQEGMIASPDGHCRAFDGNAKGTVGGSAVGVVVLKRLDDALADNDQIYAVIKATAINNDGAAKAGYTAPSVEGQSNVIRDAIEKSGVDPETISYIEAHGTATPLGDPVEISALTQAYRNFTDKKQYCAIGSVKTNIGHTDTAAGVMGLIKTVLALKHKKIPASLHFNKPNPEIDFENSPFFVNNELRDWKVPEGVPRRAGVSSFGIGGTNAHAILEEAPEREPSTKSRKQQLLLLSAKTDTSVSAYAGKLADFLKENKKEIKLADVAYTLQVGRDSIKYRRYYVANSAKQAVEVLGKKATKQQKGELLQEGVMPEIVFMFSGQGAQYVNMARGLYEQEPIFKITIDECCDILKSTAKLDLLPVLYPKKKTDIKTATDKITETNYAQPALFVVEYALAKLLMHWGIKPKTMIGHSIGEYIAATLAGVFNLKDALVLVAMRGQLMHKMKPGSMLSANLAEGKLKKLLPQDIALAAVNAPSLCVVSGETKTIKVFQDELEKKDIACSLLYTSHAFHSPMMQGAADEFLKALKKIKKSAPKIGFISNLTGKMITKDQAMSDQYWVDHLLSAVLFDKGISQLLTDKLSCLVEIGPGRSLSTFALQNKSKSKSHHVLTSVRHPKDEMDDLAMLLSLVGRLWLAGVEIDYAAFYEIERRNKISIPTYCFDHKRYWIEPSEKAISRDFDGKLEIKPNMEDWFYEPSWKKAYLPKQLTSIIKKEDNCLVFEDNFGVIESLADSFKDKFSHVVQVKAGDKFSCNNNKSYTINPTKKSDYIELFQNLSDKKISIQHVIHAWGLSEYVKDITADILASSNQLSFYSLLYLAQGLIEVMPHANLNINVLTNNIWAVLDEKVIPQMSTITGPIKVITQEHPELRCRHIDIMLDADKENNIISQWVKSTLITEFGCEFGKGVDREICYRYEQRWVRGFESAKLDKGLAEGKIEDGTVYFITGGLGGMGLSFAKYFAQKAKVKIALVSRKQLPEKSQWSDLIENNTDHAQFKIVEKLLEIESLGSEVMVCSADIANESQVKSMIDDVINKFSKIDVVIHAAGVPGGGIIDLKTPEMVEKVFAPKIQGTLFLANLMQKIKPEQFVFCSSINAIYGALSQIDYSAANAFLDAYAKYYEKLTGIRTFSINWLRWNEVGMAEETDVPDAMEKERQDERLFGVEPDEGCKIYEIIVNSGLRQVVTSKVAVEAALLAIEKIPLAQEEIQARSIDDADDIKSIVSNIWHEILGIEDLGYDDNFFDVGGHSLLAIQLLSKIRNQFNVDLSIADIFQFPTIISFTDCISEKLGLLQKVNNDKKGKGTGRNKIIID